jgi:DNA-binding NarL/FixJ family response regulator
MARSLHQKGFSSLLLSYGYQLQPNYSHGKEMIANLSKDNLPHIVIVDIDRLDTGAIETTRWLREHYPSIKVLVLCMDAEESRVKPLLDSGASGFLSKYSDPSQIKDIIWQMHTKGYYTPYWKQGGFSTR